VPTTKHQVSKNIAAKKSAAEPQDTEAEDTETEYTETNATELWIENPGNFLSENLRFSWGSGLRPQ
jgi:hypothetical protein